MSAAVEARELFRVHSTSDGDAAALQGFSLTVEPGEILTLLGPSGAGKTSFLRLLAGLDVPSAGSLSVFGSDLRALGPRGRTGYRTESVGYVEQHYARALAAELTARELVGLKLRSEGAEAAEREGRSRELLDRVGLGGRSGALPGHLSGGEQQRVALCAALVHRPRLLLADEPTGELDAANAENAYRLIARLARERGATALVVSHDDAAAEIADRLVHVRDGRVVQEGRPGHDPSLVVTSPGWVRLPDELLDAIGNPTRVDADLRGGALQITNAAVPG